MDSLWLLMNRRIGVSSETPSAPGGQTVEQAEAEIATLRTNLGTALSVGVAQHVEIATLTEQLTYWTTCAHCGETMEVPGQCSTAIRELTGGWVDECVRHRERQDGAEAEVAKLTQQRDEAHKRSQYLLDQRNLSQAEVATLRSELDERRERMEKCANHPDADHEWVCLTCLKSQDEQPEQSDPTVATLRQHDEIGWNGLAKLYEIITGHTCDPAVGLGMATSAVAQLQSEVATLRQALQRIASIPRVFAGNSGSSRLGNEMNVSLEQAREVARDALVAIQAPPAPQE